VFLYFLRVRSPAWSGVFVFLCLLAMSGGGLVGPLPGAGGGIFEHYGCPGAPAANFTLR